MSDFVPISRSNEGRKGVIDEKTACAIKTPAEIINTFLTSAENVVRFILEIPPRNWFIESFPSDYYNIISQSRDFFQMGLKAIGKWRYTLDIPGCWRRLMSVNIKKRYERNLFSLSLEEFEKLREKKVCVVGCGGLGGYIIEMLGRLGIGQITAVDKDVFEESNLNRQILSDMNSLGKSKALKAKERMELVNPDVRIIAVKEAFSEKNGKDILMGNDIVVDALDDIKVRLLLEEIAEKVGIPMIHGAIAGWYGQVTTVFPGDRTLRRIYTGAGNKGIEVQLGNPSFTPALVAAIQVSEAVKVLIGRGEILRNKLLFINLLDHEYFTINLAGVKSQ